MKNLTVFRLAWVDGLATSLWATVQTLFRRTVVQGEPNQVELGTPNSSPIDFVVTQVAGDVPVTILQAKGKLDYSTYRDVMRTFQQLYENGAQNLLVDLQAVPDLGLSGLFALYSAALLFQDGAALEPEGGIPALRYMAKKVRGTQLQHFGLLKPIPRLESVLGPSGLPVYGELTAALASFGS